MTGINADGATNARSAPTAVVAPSAAPQNTARPTITGEPEVGQELAAEDGTWTNAPTSFAYQWQRCDIDAVTCVVVVGATGQTYGVRAADVGFRLRVAGQGAERQRHRLGPLGPDRHRRPVRARDERAADAEADLGPLPRRRLYARFRICDDSPRNLTILATDSRPGKVSQTRRFTTRIAPNPCGVYTRSWTPAVRFRGKGRYAVTIAVRDTSGRTSAPVRKSYNR